MFYNLCNGLHKSVCLLNFILSNLNYNYCWKNNDLQHSRSPNQLFKPEPNGTLRSFYNNSKKTYNHTIFIRK